jgi:hypothetical protein
MFRIQLRPTLYAGLFVFPVLLAVTPNLAQQIDRSAPQSIISLASTGRPQGELLARHTGEATFEKAPANYHVFAAASAGRDAGVETLTLNFAAETQLTRIRSKNNDFVIEPGGTCHEGDSYTRGQDCTLLVRFNPQGAGHRLGFITVSNSAEAAPMSFGLTGNGYAPVVSFTPSQITTVAGTASSGTGTISGATNLAIDGGDILYIPDIGNNKIKEIDSTGLINTLAPFFATPASLAIDSLGIIYAADTTSSSYYFSYYLPWGVQTAYASTYTAGSCTPSTPCGLSAVGMDKPANMSIDAYDDLIFEEGTKGAAEMPVTNISGGTGSLNLWYLMDQFNYASGTPASFAVDAGGNLYNDYTYTTTNTCFLLEESLYSAEYSPTATRVAGGVHCGFAGDGGQARSAEISTSIGQIAFDIAGNLYFADAGNQRVRRIDALTGVISTIAGNGTAGYGGDGGSATTATLSNPTGVAVDSQGQVYILSNAPTAGPTQALRRVGVKGFWTYGPHLKGTSTVRVFTVANTGNDTLTLSANAALTGANPTNFSIDPATTTCGLAAGATLLQRHSCKIGIAFKPLTAGARSATLLLLDNTVNNSNTILLNGIGTLPAPTMSITSPTGGSSVKSGVTVNFTVSVTSTSATKPTGTVTFKVNGTAIGSPVTLSGAGTAATTFSESTPKTYSLSAVYSGDANYATVTKSESLIVTTVKVPITIIGTAR